MLPATEMYPLYLRAIEYMRQGMMPIRAAKEAGFRWSELKRAMKTDQALADLFEEALLECRDHLTETLLTIDSKAVDQVYGSPDAKMAAVLSKNIMWVLERLWPEKFMPKLAIQTESSRADEVILAALNATKAAIDKLPSPVPPAPMITEASYTIVDVLPVRDVDRELASLGL